MELETIQYFMDVAACLNFTNAAQENNISQSSLSKAIMRLEHELGAKLINRSTHPITLTPAGESFYRSMLELQPQFQKALDDVASLSDCNTLRILICPNSYQHRAALMDYAAQHCSISIHLDNSSEITDVIPLLESGKYDFSVGYRPFDLQGHPSLKATQLYEDNLYLAVTKDSPLAARDEISLRELNGQSFYLGTFTKSVFLELVRRYGIQPRNVFPKGSNSMRRDEAIGFITLKNGIGIFPGRDLNRYNFDAMGIRCIPIQEVRSFPVVLLEQSSSKDSLPKQVLRRWLAANIGKYINRPIDEETASRETAQE